MHTLIDSRLDPDTEPDLGATYTPATVSVLSIFSFVSAEVDEWLMERSLTLALPTSNNKNDATQ